MPQSKTVLTLCIIHQHPRVLLGMKKRGFGKGRWNGFGGHVEEGEAVEDAARREVQEEAGIEIAQLEKHGIIEFEFQGKPGILEVHIYRAKDFAGQPTESEEMKPEWYHIDSIPYKDMWADDMYWLPLVLAGKKIKGRFLFDRKDSVLDYNLDEVDSV